MCSNKTLYKKFALAQKPPGRQTRIASLEEPYLSKHAQRAPGYGSFYPRRERSKQKGSHRSQDPTHERQAPPNDIFSKINRKLTEGRGRLILICPTGCPACPNLALKELLLCPSDSANCLLTKEEATTTSELFR